MTPQESEFRVRALWATYDPEHANEPAIPDPIPDAEWSIESVGPLERTERGWTFATIHVATIRLWPSDSSRSAAPLVEAQVDRIRNRHPEAFPAHAFPGWSVEISSVHTSDPQPADPVRMRHDAELDWATLVDPESSYNDISIRNPHNSLRVDCVFEAYAQIVRSSEGYRNETKWTTYTVPRMLTPDPNHPFGFGFNPSPVTSLEDLKTRFQRALLVRSHAFMEYWRNDQAISLRSSFGLDVRVPQVIDPIWTSLTEMFDCRGFDLPVQLNSYHEAARRVRQVVVVLTDEGFSFLLYYGYEGSIWSHHLASTRKGEPFAHTCKRAHAQFRALIPDFEAQRNAAAFDGRRRRLEA